MRKKFWDGLFTFELRDKDGLLIAEFQRPNALTYQGESVLLDLFFRGLNAPAQFYFRLCNDTLDVGDVLTTITGEPTSNGYAPQLIERSDIGWPTIELHDGAYRVVSKQVTITASGGDIGPVNTGYIASTLDNTGILVAFVNFDVPRTILNGSSLLAKYQVTLH
jgi:hypothetical protein